MSTEGCPESPEHFIGTHFQVCPQVLIALARFYHVSVDYLLELTDEKVWHYIGAIAFSCAVVFLAGRLVELAINKLSGRFFTDVRETES